MGSKNYRLQKEIYNWQEETREGYPTHTMSGVLLPKICAKRVVGDAVLSSVLQPKEKIIHFVRHAQGHHNVAGEMDYSNYQSEEYFDAKLTPKGEQQCQHLSSSSRTLAADLLIVSPMTRTLQTASFSFPNLVGNCPWLAMEHIREASGFHPCDRRQTLSGDLPPPQPHPTPDLFLDINLYLVITCMNHLD